MQIRRRVIDVTQVWGIENRIKIVIKLIANIVNLPNALHVMDRLLFMKESALISIVKNVLSTQK